MVALEQGRKGREDTQAMIDAFISRFTDQKLLHVERIGRKYYQIQPDLRNVMAKVSANLGREPLHAGVYLGEEKGKRFYPSLALLELIGRDSRRWVKIDDNAEWLFLCGRDVFGKSVVETNVKSGEALVLSQKDEVLGYGKITGSLDRPEKVFVKNILDKGDYLRREMGKRKKSG